MTKMIREPKMWLQINEMLVIQVSYINFLHVMLKCTIFITASSYQGKDGEQ